MTELVALREQPTHRLAEFGTVRFERALGFDGRASMVPDVLAIDDVVVMRAPSTTSRSRQRHQRLTPRRKNTGGRGRIASRGGLGVGWVTLSR